MSTGEICQVAMCTADVALTTRVFSEALGFAQSGGRALWGERIAAIQGLPSGAATTAVVSWLVGRQDFVQLELFHHTNPTQAAADPTRRVSDPGWTRWGVAVDRFDLTVERLARLGITPLTEPIDLGGGRSVCLREPGTTVIVELVERGVELVEPAFSDHRSLAPGVAYVSATVSDLGRAHDIFVGALGMREVAGTLHRPQHEHLWGPSEFTTETLLLRSGTVLLELARYDVPSLSHPAASRLSDQGFQNIAVGFRDVADLLDSHRRLLALGATCPVDPPTTSGGVYVTLPDGLSLELLSTPREYDYRYGFVPLAPLGLGPTRPSAPGN